MSSPDSAPVPAPTTDLRSGPPLHEACRPLSALVGVWRGSGEVDYPTIDGPYRFGQQLTLAHDGRPFLRHEARAWLLDADGAVLRPAAWELGWWRPQPDGTVELLLSHSTGIQELFSGTTTGQRWELATDSVVRTATAKDVQAARRSYALGPDDVLELTEHRAMVGVAMTQHVTARLHRVR
ncbi:heme-binding beta-barrel domain-containing protein [Saccharopolyspora hordei]|uniref:Peroxynitrite isomerase n=1 Tax=Saccharopolyspora hordei TaxID=1838 RepID=A0A853AM87_9PSEU|nr:hypothetical protein [Saccharopolyspora hordei]